MGVTEENQADPGRRGLQIEVVQVVEQVQPRPEELDRPGLGEATRPLAVVHIASDRDDGRDFLEAGKDFCGAQIAHVQDALHTLKLIGQFGPEEPMRVGDERDAFHLESFARECTGKTGSDAKRADALQECQRRGDADRDGEVVELAPGDGLDDRRDAARQQGARQGKDRPRRRR